MKQGLDARIEQRQERLAEEAAGAELRAQQEESVEAQVAARRVFGESAAFAHVREVLDPLLLHAMEGCLKGRGEERDRAQGEYAVIEKFLRAFGRGVTPGIGRLQDVQVRQPGSEEVEGLPPGPSA